MDCMFDAVMYRVKFLLSYHHRSNQSTAIPVFYQNCLSPISLISRTMSRSSFPCPGKKKCNEIPSLIPMPKRQEPLVKAWMISSGHRVMVETRYDLSNTMAHFTASSADSFFWEISLFLQSVFLKICSFPL